jgi:hypothetical protein
VVCVCVCVWLQLSCSLRSCRCKQRRAIGVVVANARLLARDSEALTRALITLLYPVFSPPALQLHALQLSAPMYMRALDRAAAGSSTRCWHWFFAFRAILLHRLWHSMPSSGVC